MRGPRPLTSWCRANKSGLGWRGASAQPGMAPLWFLTGFGNFVAKQGCGAMRTVVRRYWPGGLLALAGLSAAALSAAQGKQTFTGKITDDECPRSNHEAMQMGPNDAEGSVACVEAHGTQYVLYDGEHAYGLSDQKTPKQFAGQQVAVTGTLDTKTSTIQVDSIAAAK